MTISVPPGTEPALPAPLAGGVVLPDRQTAGAPAGLPDESMLSSMVNDLYRDVPAQYVAGSGMGVPHFPQPMPIPSPGSALVPDSGVVGQPNLPHQDVGGMAEHTHWPLHRVPLPDQVPAGAVVPELPHRAQGLSLDPARHPILAGHAAAMVPSIEGSPAQPVEFTLPTLVNSLPEPADLFKALGPPDFPRDPPVQTAVLQPYWLEGKNVGTALERDVDLASFAPADLSLLPTQIFANVPDKPPEKPPENPPAKSFFVNKVIAMSGQKVATKPEETAHAAAAEAAIPKPALAPGALYWLPTSGGMKNTSPLASEPAQKVVPIGASNGFDVYAVREDFPILRQKVNGKPLVWLDNAATTQKPQAVIDRIEKFYEEENSNVHRAAHEMAARATDAYEAARDKVARFLGAASVQEIIFTRGTTESINLVAQTYARQNLDKDDEIIVIEYEHHSNIVPWQMITREKGAVIRVAPILDDGDIDLAAYERLFTKRTRMVAIGHVSNALGTVAPVREMIATAHRHGAVVLIDGAQSVPHFPINVQELGADFFALSGHKLFGPTGVGVLWGKKALLDAMPPWQGGGNMIRNVTFKHTTYNETPAKFEAGTGILAGAVGLGAAIDYLDRIGFPNAARHEEELLKYGQEQLGSVRGVKMIGTAKHKAGVLSFVTNKLTPAVIGEIMNKEGIAIRVGHHCAQPALAHFGLTETARPSIAFYNTREEIDLLVRTIDRALRAAS